MLPELLWGFIGSLSAVTSEILFRAYRDSILSVLHIIIPLQIILAISIYFLMKNAKHLIGGVLVFSVFNWTLRLISARYLLGEPITRTKIVAVALLFCALFVDKMNLMG
jgi:hypothetical protein